MDGEPRGARTPARTWLGNLPSGDRPREIIDADEDLKAVMQLLESGQPARPAPALLAAVAEGLGDMQIYLVLSPLEW